MAAIPFQAHANYGTWSMDFDFSIYFFLEKKNINTYLKLEILLAQPKCETIIVLTNYYFFQYCNNNIGVFPIAPGKVIALNLLCFMNQSTKQIKKGKEVKSDNFAFAKLEEQ